MSKRTKKIIVNSLTISRIIGALTLPAIFASMSVPALITLLVVLFSTDFLDGKLSRRWGVQTVGGSLLDPLGDKLLAISCMISLVNTHSFMLVPLFLEIGITVLNVYRSAAKSEKVKIPLIGKAKTWLLSVSLVLGAINLFNPEILNQLVSFLCGTTDVFKVTDDVVKASTAITGVAQVATIGVYAKDTISNKNDRVKKIEELKSLKEMLVRLFDEESFEEDKNKPLREILKK